MATFGQQIPLINTAPNAAQFNSVARICNALRNIDIGSGLVGSFNNGGLSIAAASAKGKSGGSTFPWGSQWICGLEQGTSTGPTSAFEIRVYNPYPKNAVGHADMGTPDNLPLTIQPVLSSFNGNNRAILCVAGLGGEPILAENIGAQLILTDELNTDPTLTPLYVLEASGDPITSVSLVLDIVHGAQEDELPNGFIRLYRGDVSDDIEAGKWYYLGGAVTDLHSGTYLGNLVSTTAGAGGLTLAQTVVPLYDMPNPYNTEPSPWIIDRDRIDYVIASTGSLCQIHISGTPYAVPGSTTCGDLVPKTLTEITAIVTKTSRTELEEFQLRNLWCITGQGHSIVQPPYGALAPVLISDDGVLSLEGAVSSSAPTAEEYRVWGLVEGSGGWGMMSIPKGDTPTDLTFMNITPAIVVDTETSEDIVGIGLLGDEVASEGVYYANGEGARGFIPLAGSIVFDDTIIHLQDDSTLSSGASGAAPSGQYCYCFDGNSVAEKQRKWTKLNPLGGIEINETDGLQLSVPVTPPTPKELSPKTSPPGQETAFTGSTETWTAGTDTVGVKVFQSTRQNYFDTSNKIVYGFRRLFTYDKHGRLFSIGAEEQYTIFTPVAIVWPT